MTIPTLEPTRLPNAARVPDAVQWHEGLMLAPQHFQAMWLRAEELLHYHLRAGAPFHRGVRRLAIDAGALGEGRFRVRTLEAILPDGLVVSYDESERGALPELGVDLPGAAEAAAAGGGPLTVYLVVPVRREARPINDPQREFARWVSVEEPDAVDINTGDNGIAIPRLAPQATLAVGTLPPSHVTALPIARVQASGNDYELAPYVEPLLGVARGAAIGRRVTDVLDRVRAKAELFERRVMRAHAMPGDAGLLELLDARLNLQGLGATLPLAEAMIASDAAHPYPLYLALCGLAGVVAAATGAAVPPPPTPYDHADPAATFDAVIERIDDALAALPDRFRRIRFDQEAGVFRLVLRPDWVRSPAPLLLGVVYPPDVDDRDVVEWMRAARIAARGRIATLSEERSTGARRARVDASALDIDTRPTELVFSVDTVDPVAEYVDPDGVLEISAPTLPAHGGRGRPSAIALFLPLSDDR